MSLFHAALQPALDNNGNPISGATWNFYLTGTTTAVSVYSDSGLSVSLGSIVTSDGSGIFSNIYMADTTLVRAILKNAGGATIKDIDPVNLTEYLANVTSLFDTKAEAQAASLPAISLTLRTSGYTTAGDGGGGLYKRVDALPSHNGYIRTADRYLSTGTTDATNGGYWELVPEDGAVNVKQLGAVGDGVSNDSTAIQSAISMGHDVLFPAGTYLANGLTGSTNYQRFIGVGDVNIKKNANGALFTHSGSGVELDGIGFRGDASTPVYTGDNVVLTGNNPRLINCGSRWAYGRGVKATGSHVQIIGTCDIYQTADATATGYDIEIGISGTATLYHELSGIYSSQSTGGILLVDTGSHTIVGGEFGKLTISSGTSPTGVNGGKIIGARILGNVSVGLSSASFSANQFGVITITFLAGTSQCSLDASNNCRNVTTITNSGNANNLIEREVSAGSVFQLKYGDDTTNRIITMNPASASSAWGFDGSVYIANSQAFKSVNNAGTGYVSVASVSGANDNITIGANTAGYTTVSGGSGGIYLQVNGTSIAQTYSGGLRPQADNTYVLGTATQAWSSVTTYYYKAVTRTVAQLTAAATAGVGARAIVSDSTVAASGNFGATVVGGGANAVPVFSDGTNWLIG